MLGSWLAAAACSNVGSIAAYAGFLDDVAAFSGDLEYFLAI